MLLLTNGKNSLIRILFLRQLKKMDYDNTGSHEHCLMISNRELTDKKAELYYEKYWNSDES